MQSGHVFVVGFHGIVVVRVVVGLAGFFSETHVGLGEIFFTFLLFLRYELEAGVWIMADLGSRLAIADFLVTSCEPVQNF